MKTALKVFLPIIAFFTILFLCFSALVWLITYHPIRLEPVPVYSRSQAPILQPGQSLKIMTWNLQYLAGKNYVFFYDLLDGSGPDERPSSKDIAVTLNEVARVIIDENPDIILLQEVDCGARRSDYRDQLKDLLAKLPGEYRCYISAWYWKAAFVPHPRIMGAVGMKLAVISKYKISRAVRHQLPVMPNDIFTRQFNFKRAALEARLPASDGSEFVAMSTHLDAFAQGNNTMERQVAQVKNLLDSLSAQKQGWAIGGDFNLLPPGDAYLRLGPRQQKYYQPQTELASFFDDYQAVPSAQEANGDSAGYWFTHFPNDPGAKGPDRTIDFLFFSRRLLLGRHYVRQYDTGKISDHYPVVAEVTLE
ncbi:endonuclease/exonuclease/phosphatase family protein [candidate division TA06 bacterium]|uniref:Endonuclease/exonuclease/phosphatase family protein n=1 Tax=candidate division TA06 bacterium TaxID=2250710 RepID=A0A933MLB3_UNCT6|nr:endonuclease/exonuclease/phosphatase family protein [candidate division TA06 bacterium]